jgi:hypothetical protein
VAIFEVSVWPMAIPEISAKIMAIFEVSPRKYFLGNSYFTFNMSLADELLNDFISSDEEDVKEELGGISEDHCDGETKAAELMAVDDEERKDSINRRRSNGADDNLSKIVINEINDVKKLARLISSESMDNVLSRIDEYGSTTVAERLLTGNMEDDP